MKMKEILDRPDDQLRTELVEQQKHLFELRSQAVTEKLEDPSQLAKTRKDIARIKTVMRRRQLEQAGGNGAAAKQAGETAAAEARPAARRAQGPVRRVERSISALKQKPRFRKKGGGRVAARKIAARKKAYVDRRKPRAVNSK